MSVGRNKFSRISANTRQLIIDEYLQGEVTQRELGEKYDFHYRRIATWFKEAGRYDEYLAVAKKKYSSVR